MAVMAPLAAIFMRFLNLTSFTSGDEQVKANILAIVGYGIVILAANLFIIVGINKMLKGDATPDYRVQIGGFLAGGVMAGVVLALSVFGFDIVAALQGGFGGLLSALWIAFMVPKRLIPEPEYVS
jgi:hypothetical protein